MLSLIHISMAKNFVEELKWRGMLAQIMPGISQPERMRKMLQGSACLLYTSGGLKMLTRNICSEYGEYHIQCNGLGPGYIATPQTAPLRERQAERCIRDSPYSCPSACMPGMLLHSLSANSLLQLEYCA